MQFFEKITTSLRHLPGLRSCRLLWNAIRPTYNQLMRIIYRKGIKRSINGTDHVLIAPELRGLGETYEPDVWHHLMSNIKEGDIFLDVGANIGLYAIAISKRIGPAGKVFAFEPDNASFEVLNKNIALNHAQKNISVRKDAVSNQEGEVLFLMNRGLCSKIIKKNDSENDNAVKVSSITLNTLFKENAANILKIDVEGNERAVLEGADSFLADNQRAPRLIYVEMHPCFWGDKETEFKEILDLIKSFNYEAHYLDERHVLNTDDISKRSTFEIVCKKQKA